MRYNNRFNYILSFTAALMLLLTGCKKDDLAVPSDRTILPRTIGEFIENNYDLSLLALALKKTGLIDTLKQPGAFTFFVPDNAAMNAIGIATSADIDKMNTDSLRSELRYHIIRERYFISGFPAQLSNRYNTLAGEEMIVSVGTPGDAKRTCVNGSFVLEGSKRDIGLANGVIHIIRKPLQFNKGTVQDYITKNPDLTHLAAVMKRFNYWDSLKLKEKVTVFAPDNNAFESLGLTLERINSLDTSSYKKLAFGVYTLLLKPALIFSTDGWQITGGYVYNEDGLVMDNYSVCPNYDYSGYSYLSTTFNIGGLWFTYNDAGPSQVNYSGGNARGGDHLTSNGLVHIIDALIFDPELMRK